MDHLWGISGPAFLGLYTAGLALALAAAAAVRSAVRRPPAPDPAPTLDELDLAFLAGGPKRVIETVVARLVDSGRLRTSRAGTLTTTTDERGTNPLDQLVMERVGRGGAGVGTLVGAYAGSGVVRLRGDRLAANGLLVSPSAAARARRRAVRGLWVVLAVGALRWFVALGERLPIGFLTVLLAATVVAIVAVRSRQVPPRTVHGDQALASAEERGPVVRVALHGLSAYPDREVRGALLASAGVASVAAWSYGGAVGGAYVGDTGGSGGGGGDGGSSCGSGGCGGGCGGCGGG
ncbi:TIGR04222 domain-containing membrane protein [Actinophytocola xanthii]|uniref:TIGR04222 domain-containing membrane protein n=1 Tax=Actinophytocola xanthii TaxID=1912961 RepID=A0A1Q8CMH4_9PSEU|nr:TIGR04222 domain-containing membrane protein [Actinophytocola xanthii]OLF15548.1 hypothetical protein BU204_21755 [Actinophytocola xanthii]